MTEPQEFHLGDLVSITDGHIVAPEHMDAIYRILDFLTGRSLMTHELPSAGRAVQECVYEQHPFLREIVWPDSMDHMMDFGDNKYRKAVIDIWLGRLVEEYGEYHTLVPASEWAAGNK